MRDYNIDIKNDHKGIYSEHIKFGGINPKGDCLSFTNYYMTLNSEPFFAISGEFHFTRYDERYWEEELVKMMMGGINIISTYIFWNHHEEVQGEFEWQGNKNLRNFIELCGKHDLYVIIRIGPFDHGEVRNGGMPDWLFGRPFELRSNDEEYLFYVERLYSEIGKQVKGLMYKDGGPIIGTQIENEYMHAGAPIELTTGINNEWLSAGVDGEAHMKKLKAIAVKAGIDTPFYTCTAWGGAATPLDEMIPLWGGYAFWPWIFYGDVKEHPATPEYIFRDYHNNNIPKCYNFDPRYKPEDYPYSCCEMGGGMTVFYKYRFILPTESVAAMSAIKVAGGCNFIGYYMFHGGSNPKGKVNQYLNEHAAPKISYDFQAALGEFGQVRNSYTELKLQHYFYNDFGKIVCPTKTIVPVEAETMVPEDIDTLRYAVRVKDGAGFVFINNYQDHLETKEQKDFAINFALKDSTLRIPMEGGLSIAKDGYCILPFNFDLDGAVLKYSTTQLVTLIENEGEKYYFFFTPDGMKPEYCFANNCFSDIKVDNGSVEKLDNSFIVHVNNDELSIIKLLVNGKKTINIYTLTREQSKKLWKANILGKDRIILTEAVVMYMNNELKLHTTDMEKVNLSIFPRIDKQFSIMGAAITKESTDSIFSDYELTIPKKSIELNIKNVKKSKSVINISEDQFKEVKDIMLKIDYEGDIGYAFVDGDLINDNFCNGATWEIALKRFEKQITENGMYLYISPIKKGSIVKSDSTMAARAEVSKEEIAVIKSIKAVPLNETIISF